MDNWASNSIKKRLCPYQEKCYRKNPIHFNEMSHPHLESLVIHRLNETITIPVHLDFECPDRSQLLDQLKVLQMVLKKERDRNGESSNQQPSTPSSTSKKPETSSTISKNKSSSPKSVSSTPKSSSITSEVDNMISEDLKKIIERKKQAAILRREAKLKELDSKAALLVNPLSQAKNLDDLEEKPKQAIKRNGIENKGSESKKPRTKDSYPEKEINHSSSNSQSSSSSATTSFSNSSSNSSFSSRRSQESSLVDNFTDCRSSADREILRKNALVKMRMSGYKVSVVEPGEFAFKHAISAPYHIFFTRVEQVKATYDQPLTITFPELLDKSLGEIDQSLHLNFMIDIGWLTLQYLFAAQSAKMLVMYETRVDSEKLPPNITAVEIPKPSAFGCHHTKVSILKYKDNGIRIIISTANIYSDDWENRTQGVWISPHLPRIPESANSTDGESPTGFKRDFEKYLVFYKHPALVEWIYLLRGADCSEINVFFLASVPGSHKDRELNSWGHKKLSTILSKHATLPPDAPYWSIVAQCSSIGSFGPNYENWLQKDIVSSMSKETKAGIKSLPNFQFIYPSVDNFKNSVDCRVAACCLPYSMKTHSKQEWIEAYMYQWKASKIERDRAMPHIKSYTRISRDNKKIAWFVLTSANLSKAAWGTYRQSNYIMNYEAGVVFIPKFITKGTTFPIQEEESPDVPVFPMPYDLPLTRYGPQDKPFVMEFFDG